MNSPARSDRIRALGDKYIDCLRRLLLEIDNVVFADFPNHSNVGDSLIWLGELVALQRLNKPILQTFSYVDYDVHRIRRLVGRRTAILIHGGGNFGTLWPAHHTLRLKLLGDFPGTKLIQLPQSIFFDNTHDIEHTRQALSMHGDCVVLVRDNSSHEFASNILRCSCMLVPDSAFLYYPARARQAEVRVVALRRTDKESGALHPRPMENSANQYAGDEIPTLDWVAEPFDEHLLLRSGARAAITLNSWPAIGQRLKFVLWNLHASRAALRGEAILARGQTVVTDRLHAMLLAHLLGRKVVYVDNSYGKLSNLVSTWLTGECSLVRAESWDQALAIAREL